MRKCHFEVLEVALSPSWMWHFEVLDVALRDARCGTLGCQMWYFGMPDVALWDAASLTLHCSLFTIHCSLARSAPPALGVG